MLLSRRRRFLAAPVSRVDRRPPSGIVHRTAGRARRLRSSVGPISLLLLLLTASAAASAAVVPASSTINFSGPLECDIFMSPRRPADVSRAAAALGQLPPSLCCLLCLPDERQTFVSDTLSCAVVDGVSERPVDFTQGRLNDSSMEKEIRRKQTAIRTKAVFILTRRSSCKDSIFLRETTSAIAGTERWVAPGTPGKKDTHDEKYRPVCSVVR